MTLVVSRQESWWLRVRDGALGWGLVYLSLNFEPGGYITNSKTNH